MIAVVTHATGEKQGEFPETLDGYIDAVLLIETLPEYQDGRYAIDADEKFAEEWLAIEKSDRDNGNLRFIQRRENGTPVQLPPAVPKSCNDCPWRRNAKIGWLGPYDADGWIEAAMGEAPIACHQTIVVEDGEDTGSWSHPAMRQCRGAAIFRANICKSPRRADVVDGPRDKDTVFGTPEEFKTYHEGEDA